jgi:cyclase
MNRSTGRPMLLAALGVFALAVHAGAQTPPPPMDFSKVEIKTTRIAPTFYTLEGQGGTTGALVGPDGVLLVDGQYAPLTEKLVAAIKQISDGRLRFLVNTHVHGDHTGGNENFGKLGVVILSRDQLRARLAASVPPTPTAGLPTVTYDARQTLHMNGEDVQLIPAPVAHTDGDTIVRFPSIDVIMTGDCYRAVGYPYFDRSNGGSLQGLVKSLNMVIDLAGPTTKILPGHGPIVTKTAVAEHRDLLLAIADRVSALVKQGKTADQIVAAKPTSDYDARVPGGPASSERFLRALSAEFAATK